MRDYINVVDLAKASVIVLPTLIALENGDRYEVFNIGTGKGNTVLEVIKYFGHVSGIKLNYEVVQYG